ncbi:MAG: type II toxin-antitoxin system VapC family toxin [Verrucomicrobiota bacterium]
MRPGTRRPEGDRSHFGQVLDSWALMALFHDEPAAEEVERLLHKASAGTHECLMCVVNWGEIYYSIRRGVSPEMAEQKAKEIAAMPIKLISVDDDLRLVRQAAILKATHKISYADAFAAALAKIQGAELVTGDSEFKALAQEIKIAWLK